MSPIERHVTDAVGKAQPGAALDFATIMALITQIFTFIQQCPFGRAKAAIRGGSVEAKTAAYLAVKRSGYGGNAVDLTHALLEQGRTATDAELDETIASALSLPGLTRIAGIVGMMLILNRTVIAGPFPGTKHYPASLGPFPVQSSSVQVPARTENFGETPSPTNVTPPGPLAVDVPTPLRQRIAEYIASGGSIVGVRDMTITTHMLRDHGWTAAQLDGLSEDELFALHGMQHAGLIDPADAGVQHSGQHGREESYPVRIRGDWAYWSVEGVTWSNLGRGRLAEGQVLSGGGRRFLYRNGRMHAATD